MRPVRQPLGKDVVKAIRTLIFVVGLVFATGAVSAQTGRLEVDNAWARATLVAASSPIAKKAEMHTMSMEGMVMKMRPVAGIDLPAGQAVTLQPGGLHIMLVDLAKPLKAGQTFPLTLTFEKAGSKTVNVAVEKIGAMGPAAAPQH